MLSVHKGQLPCPAHTNTCCLLDTFSWRNLEIPPKTRAEGCQEDFGLWVELNMVIYSREYTRIPKAGESMQTRNLFLIFLEKATRLRLRRRCFHCLVVVWSLFPRYSPECFVLWRRNSSSHMIVGRRKRKGELLQSSHSVHRILFLIVQSCTSQGYYSGDTAPARIMEGKETALHLPHVNLRPENMGP